MAFLGNIRLASSKNIFGTVFLLSYLIKNLSKISFYKNQIVIFAHKHLHFNPKLKNHESDPIFFGISNWSY